MVEYARIITKSSEGLPTIPPSASHDNGDWSPNDIYENELYMDTLTGFLYTRQADTIIRLSVDPAGNLVYHDSSMTGDGTLLDPLGLNISTVLGNGLVLTADGLFVDLSGYVPYTGATTDVDLGEHQLKVGQIELDQTPTGTFDVGMIRWNANDGTAEIRLKGGNVTLQIGQEQVKRVVNKTGADLLESGYKVVRARLVSEGGAAGQRTAVVLALADSDTNSATTIGVVTEDIEDNQEGFITTSGEVRGINTTGALQGETWVDGDILYLSGKTPGGLTNIKPMAPVHMVVIGQVTYAHAVNGKIDVAVQNGYELEELHNVTDTNYTIPQDEDSFLFFDETQTLWKRLRLDNLKSNLIAAFNPLYQSALGYTPENIANKGIANGYPSLDGAGKVPSTQLPSYVDDVVEVSTYSSLPVTGETGKIYITLDTNFVYRWSGSVYVQISQPNAVWGSITGTLSDQMDLYSELAQKVGFFTPSYPIYGYIGVGGNLNVGIEQSSTFTDGYLSASDWNIFNNKQEQLVSGTNIKTINGNSILGSGNLVIGGAPSWLESNATDLTLWNNGKGNVASNTSFGDSALRSNTTGARNTAYGTNALYAVVTGNDNTAFGNSAGGNITGSFNTALGSESMINTNSGANNTALGYTALRSNGTGANNTAVGSGALYTNTVNANTAVGYEALRLNTNGWPNTAVGYQALRANTTGTQNTAVGGSSMTANTTGVDNTSLGAYAYQNKTTASNNVAVGVNSLRYGTTGDNNVAVGHSALSNNTGGQNIGVGVWALIGNTSGANNVAIGYTAMYSNGNGGHNTAVGTRALAMNTTSSNTAFGSSALDLTTTGMENVAMGHQSGYNNTTGASNTFIGHRAGYPNTTGIRNTFMGYMSGAGNTTASNNTCLGNDTNTGNFNGSTILGRGATASADNQFVVGSVGIPAGAVASEVVASTRTWTVIINGVQQKILLA
jgi:hypothetical protein